MADLPPRQEELHAGGDETHAPLGPTDESLGGATSGEMSPPEAVMPNPAGRTRISGAWLGVIIAAVVLTLLLVFILQNTRSEKISFFTVSGAMPVGVALLLAAIGGVFLAAVVGSLRILQLRRRLSDAGGPSRRGRRRGARVSQGDPA